MTELKIEQRHLINTILSAYHTTRLNGDPATHILSKPSVQDAFARFGADLLRERADWFAGDVDADGNELITVRKDEWDALHTEPAPAAPDEHPFAILKDVIGSDPDYAWAWQCNLAVPIMDVTGISHTDANRAAALIMRQMFDCDITEHPNYVFGKSVQHTYFEARVAAEREEDAAMGDKP